MFDLSKLRQQLGDHRLHKRTNKRLIVIVSAVFLLLVLILGIILIFFEAAYFDRFYPGSKIGDLDLSGLTKEQAFKTIGERTAQLDAESIKIIHYDGQQEKLLLLEQIQSPDSAKDPLEFDVYKTVYDNFAVGHDGGLRRLFDQWQIFSGRHPLHAYVKVDEDYLRTILKNQLSPWEVTAVNASPMVTCQPSGCQVEIRPEKEGQSFDYDQAFRDWEDDLVEFKMFPINLERITLEPKIKKTEVQPLISELSKLFNNSSTPQFYYLDENWPMSKKSLRDMISFVKSDGQVYFIVNPDSFNKWFRYNISADIDVAAKNATIEIKNGQVVGLATQKGGRAANMEQAYQDLNTKIINNNFGDLHFALSVETTTPDVAIGDINNLGIKEIIGTGMSDFSGSPVNRRKNIKNGASKLHGLLIKPDEEFSLIKALLPVNAATGYFSELVIKGNKTTPEYGGGLCQIGTTIFRTALASGLPILERQNHSYSVTYYLENGLPGVDATIYDPKPDLKFKNDSGNYILIQSRIVGNKLYFDFWGTKDGRQVTQTKPKTWGVKSPPPTKLVVSPDLAPGQKKCTETAHKGISASFNYIVGYTDGHTATTTFTSVYKPWQEVCLVGAAAGSSTTISIDKQ